MNIVVNPTRIVRAIVPRYLAVFLPSDVRLSGDVQLAFERDAIVYGALDVRQSSAYPR